MRPVGGSDSVREVPVRGHRLAANLKCGPTHCDRAARRENRRPGTQIGHQGKHVEDQVADRVDHAGQRGGDGGLRRRKRECCLNGSLLRPRSGHRCVGWPGHVGCRHRRCLLRGYVGVFDYTFGGLGRAFDRRPSLCTSQRQQSRPLWLRTCVSPARRRGGRGPSWLRLRRLVSMPRRPFPSHPGLWQGLMCRRWAWPTAHRRQACASGRLFFGSALEPFLSESGPSSQANSRISDDVRLTGTRRLPVVGEREASALPPSPSTPRRSRHRHSATPRTGRSMPSPIPTAANINAAAGAMAKPITQSA